MQSGGLSRGVLCKQEVAGSSPAVSTIKSQVDGPR